MNTYPDPLPTGSATPDHLAKPVRVGAKFAPRAKGMIAHNLKKYPEGYTYTYGELTDLDEYDLKALPDGIDEAWYWYASAPYEGSGQILMRKGILYATHSMGHCSCYGPCENSTPSKWETFDALLAQYQPNAEAYSEVRDLFDAARPA